MDQGARAGRRASGRWTAPWWLVTIAWVLVAALGAWLIARPLSSLTVLVLLLGVGMILVGVAEIAGAREAPQPTPILAALGVAWFVLGVLVLVFRGFTTSAIGVLRLTTTTWRRSAETDAESGTAVMVLTPPPPQPSTRSGAGGTRVGAAGTRPSPAAAPR